MPSEIPDTIRYRIAYGFANTTGKTLYIKSCSIAELVPSSVDEILAASRIRADYVVEKKHGLCREAFRPIEPGTSGNEYLAESENMAYSDYEAAVHRTSTIFYAGEIVISTGSGAPEIIPVCGRNYADPEVLACAQTRPGKLP